MGICFDLGIEAKAAHDFRISAADFEIRGIGDYRQKPENRK